MPPPLQVPPTKVLEAQSLLDQAEKRANAFTFFGLAGSTQTKLEDASDLCAKAGNLLKTEKQCKAWLIIANDTLTFYYYLSLHLMLEGKEAADAYQRSADYLVRSGDRDEAANRLLDAAKCLRKVSPEGSIVQNYII